MIKIDNARMQALFAQKDENVYFYDCHDIAMAGRDGYKIKDVVYYAQHASDPLASYACQKTYYDDSVVLYLYSRDRGFAEEIARHLYEHPAREIDICSPSWNVCELVCIQTRFEVNSSETGAPVYALCDKNALLPFSPHTDASFRPASERDRARVTLYPMLLDELEEELRTADLFDACPCFDGTRFYLLEDGGRIIGFLRAECGYRNYYDVGWVYVAPAHRNKGYGRQLVSFFAHDCLANGLYPHYGYAVSDESASVAKACGFVCTHEPRTFYKLTRKASR